MIGVIDGRLNLLLVWGMYLTCGSVRLEVRIRGDDDVGWFGLIVVECFGKDVVGVIKEK